MYNSIFAPDSTSKNDMLKKHFIDIIIRNGASTIADIAKEADLSIPTVTKMLVEMKEENLLMECGKSENSGTRKATLYNINPKMGYFIGVDIRHSSIIIALTDFAGNMLTIEEYKGFVLTKDAEGLPFVLSAISQFMDRLPVDKSMVIRMSINLPGKIDIPHGICYYYLYRENVILTDMIEEKFGIPTRLDNDTRAMCYGEYMCGVGNGEENVVFVNMSWGLGMAVIADGRLYYGKSGYSGEWGHINAFDNEVLCYCGKKGCLETEASGSAIYRHLMEKYRNGSSTILSDIIESGRPLLLDDILDAVKKDDILCIELVENAGKILGKYIASLLNIFNPELVILGGSVGAIGDYLAFPVRTGIMKYTLNYVNNDTKLKVATLGRKAGAIGACILARSKCLNLIKF